MSSGSTVGKGQGESGCGLLQEHVTGDEEAA